jgi:hypothetical protein
VPGRDGTRAEAHYDIACGYALCAQAVEPGKKPAELSAEARMLRDKYAARAIECLRTAIKHGYRDAAHTRLDPDLKSLREREEFQKVLREMEEAKPVAP